MHKHGVAAGWGANDAEPRLSRASVGRLSLYLRRLESLLREGKSKVSSGALGESLGMSDAQVRKDLAYLGHLGHPGVGYSALELIGAIRRALGVNREWLAALVGVGNLGRALLHRGFGSRLPNIAASLTPTPPDPVRRRRTGGSFSR